MIKDILKELCALNGVSGNEGAVRDYIAARVKPYAAEMTTDAMGNLLVFVKGRRAPSKKVMLAAHMDEVGIIITGITEEGYLKFDFAGGVDRRVVIGKRVSVGDKAIPGVIALKAVHLVEGGERKKVPATKSLHVDIGCRTRDKAPKSRRRTAPPFRILRRRSAEARIRRPYRTAPLLYPLSENPL